MTVSMLLNHPLARRKEAQAIFSSKSLETFQHRKDKIRELEQKFLELDDMDFKSQLSVLSAITRINRVIDEELSFEMALCEALLDKN